MMTQVTSSEGLDHLAIIDDLYHEGGRYEFVLHERLGQVARWLADVRTGEHLVWREAVLDLLTDYMLGFAFYNFVFTLGKSDVEVPQRQTDLENLISALQDSRARADISAFCAAAMNGNGWKLLRSLRPPRKGFTLLPRRLFQRAMVLVHYKVLLPLVEERLTGRMVALQILSLLDKYNETECNLFVAYLKNSTDLWKAEYVARMAGKPRAFPAEFRSELTDMLLEQDDSRFTDPAALGYLARFDARALKRLLNLFSSPGTGQTADRRKFAELLLYSAGDVPDSMAALVNHKRYDDRYAPTLGNELFENWGVVGKGSANRLLDFAGAEEDAFLAAAWIAKNIRQLSLDAQEDLLDQLQTTDLRRRYLLCCALSRTVPQRSTHDESDRINAALLSIILGPWPPGNLTPPEEDQPLAQLDNLRYECTILLLEMARTSALLIKLLLKQFVRTWILECMQMLRSTLPGQLDDDTIARLAGDVIRGDLLGFSESISALDGLSEQARSGFTQGIVYTMQSRLVDALGSPDCAAEARALCGFCMAYALHSWPFLRAIADHCRSLEFDNYWVNVAMIRLAKRTRSDRVFAGGCHHYPREEAESFVDISRDVSFAFRLLDTQDVELAATAVDEVISAGRNAEFEKILMALRAIACDHRATAKILAYLSTWLDEPQGVVGIEARKTLFSLDGLGSDGVDLIGHLPFAAPSEYSFDSPSLEELIDDPRTLTDSGIAKLIQLLVSFDKMSDGVRAYWMVQYALASLLRNGAVVGDVPGILLKMIKINSRQTTDRFKRHSRAFAMLAFARSGYASDEFIDLLLRSIRKDVFTYYTNILNDDFEEVMLVAAVSLAD